MNRSVWAVPALAFVIGLPGCRRQQAYEKPLTPVSVRKVEEYTGRGGSRYSGSIEAKSRVDLAFRVAGYVTDILQVQEPGGRRRAVQEGDRVTRGTVLARLREADYAAKVQQARSQLEQATAALNQARSQVKEGEVSLAHTRLETERADKLFASQSLTKSDHDGARAKLDVAQARLEAARAVLEQAQARVEGAKGQLSEAELALADCALKAPLDAVVLKRLVEVGSLVGSGSPGFVLADTSSVEVVFGAPDVLLPSLRMGQTMPVTTEAVRGVDLTGRITRISPAADSRSRVFDVELTIPNPQNRLKPGMIASVEVGGPGRRQAGPVVPLTAVVRSRKNPEAYALYVVEEQGGRAIVRARDVTLGEALGNLIAVQQGVRVGERVVVQGASLVQDGEAVQVVP
jgi:multidrug efflux system membrane fusion protein